MERNTEIISYKSAIIQPCTLYVTCTDQCGMLIKVCVRIVMIEASLNAG